MRYSKSILKSILLSAIIFWLVIFSEAFEASMLFWVFISLVPITVCCSLTVLFTISPWFALQPKLRPQEIYKKYFPYYAIFSFALCFYCLWKTKFDLYTISFFSSAYFTSLQIWNWLVLDNQKE